jgi:Uma2 family endonuclease
VLAPDVAFVAAARLSPEAIPDTYLDLAPDLVVEVMSPSDTHLALDRKARTWIQLVARVVWVVDPKARRILVHEAGGVRALSEGDHLAGDPVLPEFHFAVRRVFET